MGLCTTSVEGLRGGWQLIVPIALLARAYGRRAVRNGRRLDLC